MKSKVAVQFSVRFMELLVRGEHEMWSETVSVCREVILMSKAKLDKYTPLLTVNVSPEVMSPQYKSKAKTLYFGSMKKRVLEKKIGPTWLWSSIPVPQ